MGSEGRKTSGISAALLGVAGGVILGMLFAPKKGVELRTDAAQWLRRNREKILMLAIEIGEEIPVGVKIAGVCGVIKAITAYMLRDTKESETSKPDCQPEVI